MLLELFHEAFLSSSLFYLYFGVLLTTIGIGYFVQLGFHTDFFRHCFLVNEQKQIKINTKQAVETMLVNEPFVIWRIVTFKRSDEASDDEDDSFSYLNNAFKIRGGQLCKQALYSQL